MNSLLAPGFIIAYRSADSGHNGYMTREEYLSDLSGSFASCGDGMSDTLTNRTIDREGDLARARVEYTYICPSRGLEQSGTDYFTFLRYNDGWKIVSIVFVKLEG